MATTTAELQVALSSNNNHLLYGNRSAVYFGARGNGDALRDCIDSIAGSSSSADTKALHTKITARLFNIACLQGRPSALVADVAVALLLSPLSDAQQRLLVAAAGNRPPVGSGASLAVNVLTRLILDFRLSFEYYPIGDPSIDVQLHITVSDVNPTVLARLVVIFLDFGQTRLIRQFRTAEPALSVKAVFKLWNDRIDSLPLTTILSWHTPSGADLSQLGSKQHLVEMLDGLLSTMPRSKLIKQASSLVDEQREFVSWRAHLWWITSKVSFEAEYAITAKPKLLDWLWRLCASICNLAKRDISQKAHTEFSPLTTSSFFVVLEYLLAHVSSQLRDHLCRASTDRCMQVFSATVAAAGAVAEAWRRGRARRRTRFCFAVSRGFVWEMVAEGKWNVAVANDRCGGCFNTQFETVAGRVRELTES
ncbi:hypothetical protein DFJ73DRAFT_774299 [Zopfochytrium polystomum]|nr:hypothetical protein DFJ73DRAFT_774299 [Zopfochytrium polystomum]